MEKEFYLYAGYYELYLSSEPMPEPYVWQATFDNTDDAIDFAEEEIGDTLIYCDNIRDHLSNPYLVEYLDEHHEWFNIKTRQLC